MSNREECVCCEKMIRIDRKHWRVHMSIDWQSLPEDYDGEDSQGTFAVGPGCRRNYPQAFRSDGFED